MLYASSAPSAAYLRRKSGEIKELAKFAPSAKTPGPPRSFLDVVNTKHALKQAIRAHAFIPTRLSESNLGRSELPFSLFGFRLRYDYQRITVRLESDDHLRAIYKSLPQIPGVKSHAFFTSSCQSAISVFFDALELSLPGHQLFLPNGAYWETIDFLNAKGRPYTESFAARPTSNAVLYFDSSTEDRSYEPDFRSLLRGYALVAVDTTCFLLNSKRLHALVSAATENGIPCVLLRSHMKLDCMALEYGRLGSYVFVEPLEMSRRSRELCEVFLDRFARLSRYYGVYASLRQLYPFYNSASFHAANNRRVEALREANAAVSREVLDLKSDLVNFKFFKHDLFFWVVLNQAYDDATHLRMIQSLDQIMSFCKTPMRFVASYPWDELGVTLFTQNQFVAEQGSKSVVRLSIPDFDQGMQAACAEGLRTWVKGLARLV